MTMLPLYPIAIALVVTLGLAGWGWRTSGAQWGQTLATTAVIHTAGFVIVSRMMYATSRLFPRQLLLAFVTIGITTKLVVFAPVFLGRVTHPTLEPSLSKRHITIGIAGAWLIQSSLGLLYLFPDSFLQAAMLWVLPTSPLNIFVWPLLVGVVVVQVVMAGRLNEAAPEPDATGSADSQPVATTADRLRTSVAPDGGEATDDQPAETAQSETDGF
jgi:hypothetical protein